MVSAFWPEGEQPVTASPVFRGRAPQLTIQSETPGASLGYRQNGGAWQLYRGPIEVSPGDEIEAKAIRYGWRESDVVSVHISR